MTIKYISSMMNMFFEIRQLGMITVVLYDGNFYLTCLSTHSSGTKRRPLTQT